MSDRNRLRIGGVEFVWGARTYVMGIVNVTPDSFSGDGMLDVDGAVGHALDQWNHGADILDVGGESTRPGHEPVPANEELARVLPVICGIRKHLPEAPISIDTYKPEVARAACDAGAQMINCVWGAPEDILEVAQACRMPLVAMHNQIGTHYAGGVVDGVTEFLRDAATRAAARDIPVILDVGIGFGKTPDQNIEMLRGLDRVAGLGLPTLLGTSRKSTIGKLTGRQAHERLFGTAASTALAIAAGVDIVRVHDVAQAREAIAVADAIVRDWRPHGWTG